MEAPTRHDIRLVHRGEAVIPSPRRSGGLGPSAGNVTKPVIAAIDGYCLAGALELVLSCDIRVATEASQFGCPEVKWSCCSPGSLLMLKKRTV
ncbi:MAG: hypothetical protein CL879_09255 [Dehalococcoidia bacterium]|nr:hypothetical protein [Dehalococcoidia bacterium]